MDHGNTNVGGNTIVIVNNSKQVSTIKKIPRRRVDAEDRSADPILRSGKRVA